MIYPKSIPSSDHYAKDEIQTRLNGLQEKWDNLKVRKHLYVDIWLSMGVFLSHFSIQKIKGSRMGHSVKVVSLVYSIINQH